MYGDDILLFGSIKALAPLFIVGSYITSSANSESSEHLKSLTLTIKDVLVRRHRSYLTSTCLLYFPRFGSLESALAALCNHLKIRFDLELYSTCAYSLLLTFAIVSLVYNTCRSRFYLIIFGFRLWHIKLSYR